MEQILEPERYHLQSPELVQYLPPVPQRVEDTGLPFSLIQDLVLRALFTAGMVSGLELSRLIHLPYVGVVDAVVDRLRREKWVEYTGGPGFGRAYFDYLLTERGRERAKEAFERSTYVGPAPVPLAQYSSLVRKAVRQVPYVGRASLDRAFHDLVLEESFLERLGPAINSVRSMFLYGPPGNGKTSVAERVAAILNGEVLVPYALEVDSQVIQVFDPLVHRPVTPLPRLVSNMQEGEDAAPPPQAPPETYLDTLEGYGLDHLQDLDEGATIEVRLPAFTRTDENTDGKAGKVVDVPPFDQRWVLSARPHIIVGGELTLENLDLIYNPIGRFYEAPYQLKAVGGMLLIDDFGRQRVHPTELLNRWIVPLEKKLDFLTVRTGKKFEVPFDLLIIFSTNLDPSQLVDEAFLRRIRYKLEVPDPSEPIYRSIFRREAERQGVRFDVEVLDTLLTRYYRKVGRQLRACHPRDILQLVVDHARFQQVEPAMTRQLVEEACDSYFVHMEGDTKRSWATKATGVEGPVSRQ